MLLASTTLTTLTFFTTLPLHPSLSVTKPLHAGVLLSLYHLPSLFLHPYILHSAKPSPQPYSTIVTTAILAFLLSLPVPNFRAILLPFAYVLLGVANSGFQTIAAVSQPPDTLSVIDFLGTIAATLAPLSYNFRHRLYIPFGILLFGSLTIFIAHLLRPANEDSTQPLLEKRQSESLSITSLLSPKTIRPLVIMLFSTASLTLLHPTLSTTPSPIPLSLLALSALSEPFSTSLLHLGANRITLASTLITAIGTHLLNRNLYLGVVLLGAGASAAAVVSVADVAESAGVVFDDMRSAVALVAGVTFAVGQVVGCLMGTLPNVVQVWEIVCVVVVAVAMIPFLICILGWCVRPFKFLIVGDGTQRHGVDEPVM